MIKNQFIRLVEKVDLPQLQQIARQTFVEAFGSENTKQAFNKYLDKNFNLDQLQREYDNPHSTFYFLENAHEIMGYLKLNVHSAQTEKKLADALEIERIYLLKKYRGQSLGKVLMDKAIETAQKNSKKVVWLGVWEHNPSSIKFYQKYGFKIFDKHNFMMGDEAQKDFLMKLEL